MAKKIGIIYGSLRKDSFSKKIALALLTLMPENAEAEIVDISLLPMYNQDFDDENNVPETFEKYRQKIKSLDGIIFVTPEYNRSVPAVLKNAVDVGSRPYGKNVWGKKPAAVIGISPGNLGGSMACQHLRQSLSVVNCYVMAQPEAYLSAVSEMFDKEDKLSDGTAKFLQTFLKSFMQWTEKLS